MHREEWERCLVGNRIGQILDVPLKLDPGGIALPGNLECLLVERVETDSEGGVFRLTLHCVGSIFRGTGAADDVDA